MEHEHVTPIYLTEKNLAARWNITIKTLQRWRWQGGGPPFLKFGGNVRYALNDILNYENLNRFFSTSERSPRPDENRDGAL